MISRYVLTNADGTLPLLVVVVLVVVLEVELAGDMVDLDTCRKAEVCMRAGMCMDVTTNSIGR